MSLACSIDALGGLSQDDVVFRAGAGVYIMLSSAADNWIDCYVSEENAVAMIGTLLLKMSNDDDWILAHALCATIVDVYSLGPQRFADPGAPDRVGPAYFRGMELTILSDGTVEIPDGQGPDLATRWTNHLLHRH